MFGAKQSSSFVAGPPPKDLIPITLVLEFTAGGEFSAIHLQCDNDSLEIENPEGWLTPFTSHKDATSETFLLKIGTKCEFTFDNESMGYTLYVLHGDFDESNLLDEEGKLSIDEGQLLHRWDIAVNVTGPLHFPFTASLPDNEGVV